MKPSTDDLIRQLGAGLQPSPPHVLDLRVSMALAIGACAALLLMMATLGIRPDLQVASQQWILWGKIGYAAILTAGGYLLCVQAARPAARPRWRIAVVLLPVALAVTAATLHTFSLPAESRRVAWLGETAAICPWLIGMLSLPCLLALCLVMRRAAPTKLRWAGFCAGLLAGAISMLVYALHCPEEGIAFIASWYTLGMCLPAALGTLIGPRLLRW